MRRSEWLIRITLAFCLFYGVVAIEDRGHERFPIFAWDLFANVPQQDFKDFSVRLVQAQGAHVPLPAYFEEARLSPLTEQIQGYKAIQTFGAAIARGYKRRAAVLRSNFESTYLGSLTGVRYEVVRRTYDPRKRLECRTCITSVRVIATYTTG